jgi:chromosome segregation ATPase
MAKTTAKVKENAYVNEVLKGLNKTEAQKQFDQIEKFQSYAIIDCERQISIIESEIKEKNTDLSLYKKGLVLAEKEVKAAIYGIATNYEEWVSNINKAEKEVNSHKKNIDYIEDNIKVLEAELAKHKRNFDILQP